MRNTSKSRSLLRAQADRKQRDASTTADGALTPAGDSAPHEPGERSGSAAMRSARSELSKHARAVEDMNEAVHPQD
ncbi:hypothetical protein R3Q06_23800 [Rhodococcus erythropolis]|uniref:hypothetical protein n=1 Tax=Rhodococcus erythropolis TaxID=1833 RepID=UPI00294A0946|nr:hypothetical protein [Rhodococcus erythropolis]MDV6276528.1 hypothetical protein [Rhodococcus erythropolis]